MTTLYEGDPHRVFDGKWGGWGPAFWHYGKGYGFAERDVLEWASEWRSDNRVHSNARWVRVWIDAEQKWREFTAEEIQRIGPPRIA